jgi:hypothetical protein
MPSRACSSDERLLPFMRGSMADSTAASADFARVETWVFDLDNTLYPHHLNLWHQVDERIREYVADYLEIAREDAFRIQKDYYKRYGTTMRGMMAEHGMSPDAFLDYVHRIDHSPLTPNPALGAALERLPGRKLILTNGTRKHADAVMRRRPTTASSPGTASTRARPRCSRIWRATSRCRTRSA